MVIVVKLTFERFRFRAEIGEVDIRSSTINDGIHVFTRLFRAILVVERNLEMNEIISKSVDPRREIATLLMTRKSKRSHTYKSVTFRLLSVSVSNHNSLLDCPVFQEKFP